MSKNVLIRWMRMGMASLMLSAAPLAWAATWQVNRVDDPASGSAARCAPGNAQTCSLRDAIAAAQHGDTAAFDGPVVAAAPGLAGGGRVPRPGPPGRRPPPRPPPRGGGGARCPGGGGGGAGPARGCQ